MEGSYTNNTNTKEEEEEEESGWTAYFEDFSNNENYSLCDSSMVSDAASSPPLSKGHYGVSSSPNILKKLNFKATRAKEISHLDDSLEDTASSPVNSPKVGDVGVIDLNSRKVNDYFNSSLGKGGSLENYGKEKEMEAEERHEKSSCSETKDLKKRGLCLVPLSMLVNYHA
ncbi:hypothetical protein M5689_018703 [Euphorbia peplus]|nr:hypothetical protein M5689_018703 [Euphorbia peplus]